MSKITNLRLFQNQEAFEFPSTGKRIEILFKKFCSDFANSLFVYNSALYPAFSHQLTAELVEMD